MYNVMLDLETMGNTPNAAIIAIGAVRFDPETMETSGRFYRLIELDSAIKNGGVADASTILWWLAQSDEARHELTRTDCTRLTISAALYDFSEWLDPTYQNQTALMWGNGAAFDNVILANAYRNNGIPTPWKFWNDRCYRTIKSLYPNIKLERAGTHHNALDDAMSQAQHLMQIMQHMKTKGWKL